MVFSSHAKTNSIRKSWDFFVVIVLVTLSLFMSIYLLRTFTIVLIIHAFLLRHLERANSVLWSTIKGVSYAQRRVINILLLWVNYIYFPLLQCKGFLSFPNNDFCVQSNMSMRIGNSMDWWKCFNGHNSNIKAKNLTPVHRDLKFKRFLVFSFFQKVIKKF